MSEHLTQLHPQSDFPEKDLTDENASMLMLLLQNKEIRNSYHTQAERTILLYALAHSGILAVTKRTLNQESTEGIHAGILTYEAMNAAVRPIAPKYEQQIAVESTAQLQAVKDSDEILTLLINARSRLLDEQPLAAEIVSSVAKRYSARLAEGALLGAAMSRSVELDAIDRTKLPPPRGTTNS